MVVEGGGGGGEGGGGLSFLTFPRPLVSYMWLGCGDIESV